MCKLPANRLTALIQALPGPETLHYRDLQIVVAHVQLKFNRKVGIVYRYCKTRSPKYAVCLPHVSSFLKLTVGFQFYKMGSS